MNKKTLTIGLLPAMVAGSMLFASSASAFWPFDSLFSKGQVKAITTDNAPENRSGAIASVLSTMKSACDQFYGSANIGKVQQVVTSEGNVAEIKTEELSNEDVKKMGGSLVMETGSWKKDDTGARELRAIEAGLKARCNQINSLYTRLMKLYTEVKPTPTVTPTKRPTVTKKPTPTPTWRPMVTTKPTPSPKTGCYYQEVRCIKAPCEKILVCPNSQTTKIVSPEPERPPRVQIGR